MTNLADMAFEGNVYDHHILHEAIIYGDEKFVEDLLDHSASPQCNFVIKAGPNNPISVSKNILEFTLDCHQIKPSHSRQYGIIFLALLKAGAAENDVTVHTETLADGSKKSVEIHILEKLLKPEIDCYFLTAYMKFTKNNTNPIFHSALHDCLKNNDLTKFYCLLCFGWNPNTLNDKGYTPLMQLITDNPTNMEALVLLLSRNNLDLSCRTPDNKIAKELAQDLGKSEIVDLLSQYELNHRRAVKKTTRITMEVDSETEEQFESRKKIKRHTRN